MRRARRLTHLTRKEIDELTEFVKTYRAQGPRVDQGIRRKRNGSRSFAKFLSDERTQPASREALRAVPWATSMFFAGGRAPAW